MAQNISYTAMVTKPNQISRRNRLQEALLLKGFYHDYGNTWIYKCNQMSLVVRYHTDSGLITVLQRYAPFTNKKQVRLVMKDNITHSINQVLTCVDNCLAAHTKVKVFNKVHVYYGDFDTNIKADVHFIERGLTDATALEEFIKIMINTVDKTNITIATSNGLILLLICSWFKLSFALNDYEDYRYILEWVEDVRFPTIAIKELSSNLPMDKFKRLTTAKDDAAIIKTTGFIRLIEEVERDSE